VISVTPVADAAQPARAAATNDRTMENALQCKHESKQCKHEPDLILKISLF